MKTIFDLKSGSCKAIVECNGIIRKFNAIYDEEKKIVFFAMPDRYSIIGYEQ